MNIDPMDATEQALLTSVQAVALPQDAAFWPVKVDIQYEPHVYMWTRLHVQFARSNNTTLQAAVNDTTRPCGRACGITFANHKKLTVLTIARARGVDVSVSAQAVLFDWLVAVATAVGMTTFTGFEFVTVPAPLTGSPNGPRKPVKREPLPEISVPSR